MVKNKGFTLIELLIIVAIISLLAAAIMVSMNQSRKNARLNSVKMSMKSVLPAIIACNDGGGAVAVPGLGGASICQSPVGLASAKWPTLDHGYAYVAGGNYTANCNFQVNTNLDETKLGNTFIQCSCASQICE